ncbi:succinoglycan biosynthesis glycosyltransferase ExoA [Clostridium sediminicola]|uniref:glycosyltransferase n=1 Tax=Clostridium sediminicola TaxID=3114879 RepID=UPI0031F1F3C4
MQVLKNSKTVSIIIPCKNEKEYIKKCIDSFTKQTYDDNLYEILVCDGTSNDGTREIVLDYEEKFKNVKLINNIGESAPKGMNLGIKNSKSDIIIIFGAHSEADKDFIKNNVEILNREDVHCCGGPIETINENTIGKAISLAMSSPFGVGNALFRYSKKEKFVDTVAFGAYKRDVLDDIGYFDEELVRGQDFELNFRLTENNYNILLSPNIRSKYYSRSSIKNLWNQYFQYGFWKMKIISEYKKVPSIRHIIPTMFVLFNVFGILGGMLNKYIFVLWLFIMSLYFLMDIYFSFKLCKKNFKIFSLLILIFPILHVSYGIGFIIGFFAFSLNFRTLIYNNSRITR